MEDHLFTSLESDITLSLLFLKSIKRVRIEVVQGEQPEVTLRSDVWRQAEDQATVIKDAKGQETRFIVQSLSVEDLINEPRAEELKKLGGSLKVPARVSVAACISKGKEQQFKDRLSVMLPLPALPSTRTGLPVVVNAFFALGESRYARLCFSLHAFNFSY